MNREKLPAPAYTRVTSTTWLMTHRRFLLLASVAAAASISLGAYILTSNAAPGRTLKIGFRDAPPDHFRDDYGNPSGPAVEVITEAARRKNIRLQWVYSPQGPEKALSVGEVDLWPLLGDTAGRRRTLYVSSPWIKMTFILVFPKSLPLKGPEDVAGKRLAVPNGSLDLQVANQSFGHATIVTKPRPGDVIETVCTGAAQVGLLARSTLSESRVSECPQVRLQSLPVPGATFWFGVGANKQKRDARHAADMLRDEIGRMADDGTLAGIDFRWHTSLGTEVSTIFQYGLVHYYVRALLAAFEIGRASCRERV